MIQITRLQVLIILYYTQVILYRLYIRIQITYTVSISLHTSLSLIAMAALQDLLRYCGLALVLQIAISMLSAARIGRSREAPSNTIKRVADVFIAAFPTSLPAVIAFGLTRCTVSLKGHHIGVHNIENIKTAAAVNTVVFDKTGTLTGSMVRFLTWRLVHAHVTLHGTHITTVLRYASHVLCNILHCSQCTTAYVATVPVIPHRPSLFARTLLEP